MIKLFILLSFLFNSLTIFATECSDRFEKPNVKISKFFVEKKLMKILGSEKEDKTIMIFVKLPLPTDLETSIVARSGEEADQRARRNSEKILQAYLPFAKLFKEYGIDAPETWYLGSVFVQGKIKDIKAILKPLAVQGAYGVVSEESSNTEVFTSESTKRGIRAYIRSWFPW